MAKKIDIDKTMDECVSIQNQIDGLKLLLIQRKQTLAKYFESTGKKQLSNEDCVIYVSERTDVDYDVDAILDKVDSDLTDIFITKDYEILDWNAFVKFMKAQGVSGKSLRPYIKVKKQVDKPALSKLYDAKKINLKDLEGCYTAKVSKSVVLRLKDAKQEINLT